MVVSVDPLDSPAHTVLAEAARLAGRNPAGTRDLLLAVLANRVTPVADVLRTHGVHLQVVHDHPVPGSESGDEKLASGEHVSSALADAVRRAVLRERYAEHTGLRIPVTPAKLLVSVFSDEDCAAARQALALHVPLCRLRHPLDQIPAPVRIPPPPRRPGLAALLRRLRRGSPAEVRHLVVALAGPAGTAVLPALGSAGVVAALAVLVGWGGALSRLRPHWLPHGLTAAGGVLCTLAGLAAAEDAGVAFPVLLILGAATEGGVCWCAASAREHPEPAGPPLPPRKPQPRLSRTPGTPRHR